MKTETSNATKTPTLPTADEIARARAERQARGAVSNGKVSESDKARAITAARMDDDGIEVVIAGVPLLLKGLPPKRARLMQDALWEDCPPILLYIAVADRYGRGIDYARTAEFVRKAKIDEECAEDAVVNDVNTFANRLMEEAGGERVPAKGFGKRAVDALAEVVWMLASDTPGLERDAIAGLLEDRFRIRDLAVLVRALFAAMGDFPGSMADRFTTP